MLEPRNQIGGKKAKMVLDKPGGEERKVGKQRGRQAGVGRAERRREGGKEGGREGINSRRE